MSERILVNAPVLHDDRHGFGWLFQCVNVFKRVGVQNQNIGKCVLLDDAELARIGVAQVGKGEEFRIAGGGHAQGLGIRIPLAEMGEHETLPWRQLG